MIRDFSSIQLFELLFSKDLKNYMIESTRKNNYNLTLDDLDVFLGIIALVEKYITNLTILPQLRDNDSQTSVSRLLGGVCVNEPEGLLLSSIVSRCIPFGFAVCSRLKILIFIRNYIECIPILE